MQPIKSIVRNATLVPLNTNRFDLDVIQRLHHGITVIHCDPTMVRSTLCVLTLDPSCSLLSWRKADYLGTKDTRDKVFSNSKILINCFECEKFHSKKFPEKFKEIYAWDDCTVMNSRLSNVLL